VEERLIDVEDGEEDEEESLEPAKSQRKFASVKPVVGMDTAADESESGDLIRGMTSREFITWLLFRALARGDFHHDFGERIAARDLIVAGDENRFFEIAKLVSKKGSVWLRTQFKQNVTKTLYDIIGDRIDTILPPSIKFQPPTLSPPETQIKTVGVDKGSFASENDLLSLIGLNWNAFKTEVANTPPGTEIKKNFKIPGIDGGRDYVIRACPYRQSLNRSDPGYKINTAPIDALRIVSGGKQKFALVVDASGGLPLSDLLDRTLIKKGPGGEVYIIENIENRGDSATKLANFTERPIPGSAAAASPAAKALPIAPTLRFLRDKENTVNYPLWREPENATDPKSNIYSTMHIVLNRVSDSQIEANLLVKGFGGKTIESFSIGDISDMSNVKNATLYALAIILEKGIVNEALVYPLIKRMGDWCQALSLLDVDRIYTIYNTEGKTLFAGGGDVQTGGAAETTLRKLQTDTEIGVVTNDRILLAFCIFLGLNVFFTSAMDIARLIYFKNTKDLPTGPELAAKLNQDLGALKDVATLQAQVKAHLRDDIVGGRDAFITETLDTADLPGYIIALRSLLSNLARLRLDLNFLVDQYKIHYATATQPQTSKNLMTLFTATSTCISLQSKIETDIAYNKTVLDDLKNLLYPDSNYERIRLDALRKKLAPGGRITTSVEVKEAKDILLECKSDILQLAGKMDGMLVDDSILRTFTGKTDKEQTNFDEITSVYAALKIAFPPRRTGGQRGGGLTEDVNVAIAALSVRKINVLSPQSTGSGAGASTAIPEVTSTTNIYTLGGIYYDKRLHAYTVADEYIITKDDLPTFKLAFRGFNAAAPLSDDVISAKLRYISFRYLLKQLNRKHSSQETSRLPRPLLQAEKGRKHI
jgi:hypothetical protein